MTEELFCPNCEKFNKYEDTERATYYVGMRCPVCYPIKKADIDAILPELEKKLKEFQETD